MWCVCQPGFLRAKPQGVGGRGWGGVPLERGVRRGARSWGRCVLTALCARSMAWQQGRGWRHSAPPPTSRALVCGGRCTLIKASSPTDREYASGTAGGLASPQSRPPRAANRHPPALKSAQGPAAGTCSQLLPPERVFKRSPVTGDIPPLT